LFFTSALLSVYLLYLTRDLALSPVLLGVLFGCGGVGWLLGAVLAPRAVRQLGDGSYSIGSAAG
jgi:hypothetical protein